MAELLDRARLLINAGPYNPRAAELAAVHAAIYPSRDAVCETCPAELGKAYYAIKRWLDQQDNSSSTSTTSTVKKSEARFHSDTITYTPHGLGIAYTNDNLTDKAAHFILKNDPDAAQFFKVLPPDAEDGEDDEQQPVAEQALATDSTPVLAQTVPTGFDYAALARAMVDEMESREASRNTQPTAPVALAQPPLTASTGGAAYAGSKPATDNSGTDSDKDSDGDQDDESPVRLSRMNKAQLVAAYTTEVGSIPAENLTNDDLRDAITAKRSATPQA